MGIDVDAAFRRYGPMVLRRCLRLLGDEEKAMDATQDVFTQLVRHRLRLEPRGLSSLLYRMATNVCLNRVRSMGRRPEVPDGALVASIASHEDRTLARGMLERIFGLAPASTATIAALHLLDGMTLEEVAREVGMSVSGVRKRLRDLKAVAAVHE